MSDVDKRLREELSAHLETHPSLDEAAFSLRLAERKKKRLRARALTGAGAAVLIALAVVGTTSLDLTGDRKRLQPAKPRPFEADAIQVPGNLDRIAMDRQSNTVWVLNQRGQIGRLEGSKVRLGAVAVDPTQSGWRAFAAGRGETLWVSSGRRLDRVDGSGEVTASTRLTGGGYIQHLEVGSGYLWAADGSGSLFRIDPVTLEHQRVMYVPEQDFDDILTDHLAAGFGAAWVGSGLTGEIVRVDAETLELARLPVGALARSQGEVGGYVNAVAIGNTEVWACCDDADDVMALDPRSLEVVKRFDFGDGDDEAGGDQYLSFGDEQLWAARFGRWKGFSFDGLFRVDQRSGIEGPFPLPSEGMLDLVATDDGLFVSSETKGLYRLDYSDVADLPYPTKPPKSKTPLWIVLGIIAAVVGLVLFLGREEADADYAD